MSFRWFRTYTAEEKAFKKAMRQIVGASPGNLDLYTLAMQHSSIAKVNAQGFKESNERLEYLGDAVLGTVVAEYLFKKYPFKDEGFLTEVRSRIVNRESLNRLARKIGLGELIMYEGNNRYASVNKSMYGDAMEAFLGAVYLDKGFEFTRKYIVNKLIMRHYDLDDIIENNTNYKSLILEWSQKQDHVLNFEISTEAEGKSGKQFVIDLFINEALYASGFGPSKKKAEQDAARKALDLIRESGEFPS